MQQNRHGPFFFLVLAGLMLGATKPAPPQQQEPEEEDVDHAVEASLTSFGQQIALHPPEAPQSATRELKAQIMRTASVDQVRQAAEPSPEPTPEPTSTPSPDPPEETSEPAPEPAQDVYTAADAVADCESGDIKADGTAVPGSYSLTAQNPVSSASGKYQFIDSTWRSVTGLAPPASAHPEHVQDAAFQELWNGGAGAHHWSPSRHCWQHLIP